MRKHIEEFVFLKIRGNMITEHMCKLMRSVTGLVNQLREAAL